MWGNYWGDRYWGIRYWSSGSATSSAETHSGEAVGQSYIGVGAPSRGFIGIRISRRLAWTCAICLTMLVLK